MSLPEDREFTMLLAAHGNRELTDAESERLRALAAADARRAAELAGVDDVLERFATERALLDDVAAPLTPREAGDAGYQRLQRAAARAEDELRARCRHGRDAASATMAPRRRARWLLVAASVAVGAGAWFWFAGGDRPALLDQRPSDAVLGGGTRIVLEADLSRSRREFTWHAVVGAIGYDAAIAEKGGVVVLQRPDAAARSTQWLLTSEQIAALERRADAGTALVLRVAARDATGAEYRSSGDVPVRFVD